MPAFNDGGYTSEGGLWFALGGDGALYPLGECDSFTEAERYFEQVDQVLVDQIGCVWIVDEQTARQWQKTLNEGLPCSTLPIL
jgi:secreted PhoX family phosphatase